jgi:hypothetical protein
MAGHHDGRNPRTEPRKLALQFRPGHVGHLQIDDQAIRRSTSM